MAFFQKGQIRAPSVFPRNLHSSRAHLQNQKTSKKLQRLNETKEQTSLCNFDDGFDGRLCAVSLTEDADNFKSQKSPLLSPCATPLLSPDSTTSTTADEPTTTTTTTTTDETHDWQLCDAMFPALSREVRRELQEVEKIMLMEETEDMKELNTLRDTTTIKVAMDSGACRHVAHPKTMRAGVMITVHTSGTHFSGAGGETIERFGDATTLGTLKNSAQVVNKWNLADVVRPLHSVAEITGPADHPKGNYDVLFNNRRCVVVEAGVVEHIMQHLQAVSEYSREGNLYTAEMVLSPFGRPDLKA